METITSGESSSELALYRQSTNIAGLCKDIVLKSAVDIEGRKYVKVEGWMSIAVAHGCIATIKSVEVTPTGTLAVAEIRRQSDGAILTTAEGFVGTDEPVWYGGEIERFNKYKNIREKKTLVKRPEYAIRAMAQTRAVSRACRTAFAHVVVLMNSGLETVPAEEAGADGEGFVDLDATRPATATAPTGPAPASNPELEAKEVSRSTFEGGKWKTVSIHFGKNYKGQKLGEMTPAALAGWLKWTPKEGCSEEDKILRLALDVAKVEKEGAQ